MEKKRASEQSNKRYNRDHVRWNSDNQKSIKPPYFFSMCKVSSGCFVFSYGLLVALRSRCLFGILLHSFLERLLFDFYLLSFYRKPEFLQGVDMFALPLSDGLGIYLVRLGRG